MKDLIEYIVKNIVDNPDAVKVDVQDEEKEIVVHLTAHEKDLGHLIGKKGRTINALRTLAKTIATREKKHLTLEITE